MLTYVDSVSLFVATNRPQNNSKITAHAGIDDIDFDLEYELLETKYRDGASPVKRVVKSVDGKQLKVVPAKGVLFGIEHVEDLDEICFLE